MTGLSGTIVIGGIAARRGKLLLGADISHARNGSASTGIMGHVGFDGRAAGYTLGGAAIAGALTAIAFAVALSGTNSH